jgi:hypothetical protein
MNISIHVLASIVLSIITYPLFGWWAVLVFVGGVFVDIDHYFVYVLKTKDWSLKRAVVYYKKKKYKQIMPVIHHLHTIEFFMVVVILSFFYTFALAFRLGYILHVLLDFIHCIYYKEWKHRSNSLLYELIVHKRIV